MPADRRIAAQTLRAGGHRKDVDPHCIYPSARLRVGRTEQLGWGGEHDPDHLIACDIQPRPEWESRADPPHNEASNARRQGRRRNSLHGRRRVGRHRRAQVRPEALDAAVVGAPPHRALSIRRDDFSRPLRDRLERHRSQTWRTSSAIWRVGYCPALPVLVVCHSSPGCLTLYSGKLALLRLYADGVLALPFGNHVRDLGCRHRRSTGACSDSHGQCADDRPGMPCGKAPMAPAAVWSATHAIALLKPLKTMVSATTKKSSSRVMKVIAPPPCMARRHAFAARIQTKPTQGRSNRTA